MGVTELFSSRRLLSRRVPRTVAAVDLGSNSFHMIVARPISGHFHVVDRLQEMVRLAAGLDDDGNLDKASRGRALECLARFGERLRGMPDGSVRAVGTNTMRRARNGEKFLQAAERALGHRIEIISGQEEARLIYQGVARDLSGDDARRLIVDIGGGSTEFIVGRGQETLLAESLHMGCVEESLRHFSEGRITAKRWHRAETAAHLELQPIEAAFRAQGWNAVYGASGTIRAVGAVLRAQGWTEGEITHAALRRLRDLLLAARELKHVDLQGLSPERLPVFPGGVAILMAVFDGFGIERMEVSESGLREGLLNDLLGRIRECDPRSRTVVALCERHHVDMAQASRVERTAQYCLSKAAAEWGISELYGRALAFAARLHEVGLAIAHTKYHRHGAYLVEHSDLPGFSWQEQRLLAVLIRGHRRRFPIEVLEPLPPGERRLARRLMVLLRLAVLLHRGRTKAELPRFHLVADKSGIALRFPRGWLRKNPLTHTDLIREAKYLKTGGFRLDFA